MLHEIQHNFLLSLLHYYTISCKKKKKVSLANKKAEYISIYQVL